jgi:nucleoid-associated protein YgaU
VAIPRWFDGEDSVTAAKKLFLAASIVAAGYAIAFLLGRPYPTPVSQVTSQAGERLSPTSATVAPSGFDSWSPAGSARLVPDPQGEAASHFRPRENGIQADAPLPNTKPMQHALAANSPPIEPAHVPQLFAAAPEAQPIPRAKLLNEAPRPIADGQHSTPAPQPLTSPWYAHEPSSQVDARAIGQSQSHDVMPAQFATTANTVDSPTNVFAAGSVSTSPTRNSVAPPGPLPFTKTPEADGPRSHIVVDGDSLAKLAGRYLDDPHRGEEIYELNRHLLTNPELLPIGVELAIPARSAATGGSMSPQSFGQRTVATHAPAASGLVPIRPIPRGTSVAPRAFLAAPRQAE